MLCFYFQAEDGIRDLTVTGVQTCALPIYLACSSPKLTSVGRGWASPMKNRLSMPGFTARRKSGKWLLGAERKAGSKNGKRSEERRVGKECRARWAAEH